MKALPQTFAHVWGKKRKQGPLLSYSLMRLNTDAPVTWEQETIQEYHSSSSWASQTTLACSPSSLECSCPCTWSLCWGTCSSSWPSAQTPTYFFLANLSFVDICFISTTVPRMLVNIQTQSKGISYIGRLTQVYFFLIFTVMDSFLLTVMAYDRFVAICHPLHYMVIMNPRFCGLLVLMCWLIIFWVPLIHILLLRRLNFCTGTEIPHFFCELAQTLKVACSDILINNIFLFVATALLGVFPLIGILFSYSRIVSSLMRISSAAGKYKAFSTCGSHLSVVSLFYGTGVGIYLTSAVTHSPQRSSIASVMYTVLTHKLNPFIYSLRNKDVKGALGRLLGLGTTCL